MLVVRPIQASDYQSLRHIAIESGPGFTSLVDDPDLLQSKIERAQRSFASDISEPGDQGYLLVLEDTDTGEVVGTTAIEAAVGLKTPLYHYHVGKSMHQSTQLGIQSIVTTLTVCNNYMGCSELCSLYLLAGHRRGLAGRLLSKVRFLLMAQHPQRFSDFVIAQMLGVADEEGRSPFWSWLEQHFIKLDFSTASRMVGSGDKGFVPELMPRHPIYTNLLGDEAQAVIGKVHQNTEPALRMLHNEGFNHRGYIDLFDAGPTVEAPLSSIKSVRDSIVAQVEFRPDVSGDQRVMVSNTGLTDFRALISEQAQWHAQEQILLLPEALQPHLQLNNGDAVRFLDMGRTTA
ncbi:arginine N-succinyltransferase [Bacterioplanes sanyensis]|uniref:Arginine N-succinyltransferase n=1 Tax=Bacterioplanes sanyensis TaxID=1249553 RepID=A0A222FFV1_9GAMM|nr:arginine N-succinyltransferase [Bacterioplanes sanyensis]ASP37291.1 arginine N-succinyltransferase [Bacterioplanes sanyensis]